MTIARRHLALSAVLALAWSQPAWAVGPEEEGDDQAKPEIVITGTLAANQSASSTGLPLTLRETPQSVTIIDRSRIDDFALTNINDLLDQAVGINVERVETDRTYFNARGFDITLRSS
jgi:outer membrane receptor for ferric coprogen and ferric-rhodotorulic acid